MTLPIIDSHLSAAARLEVEAAWDRYHATVQEHGAADEWDRLVIDRVILAVAREGRRFSVNDFRELLPEVRNALISRRLIAASRAGWIRTVGVTHSTLPSTKGARVSLYEPIPGGLPS